MALMGFWITDILRRQTRRLEFQVRQTIPVHQATFRNAEIRNADLAAGPRLERIWHFGTSKFFVVF